MIYANKNQKHKIQLVKTKLENSFFKKNKNGKTKFLKI